MVDIAQPTGTSEIGWLMRIYQALTGVGASPEGGLAVQGVGGDSVPLRTISVDENNDALNFVDPAPVKDAPFTTIVTGQVAIDDDPTVEILAADSSRRSLWITVSAAAFIGPAGMTAATGLLLATGATINLKGYVGAIHARTASGAATVSFLALKD